MTEAPVQLLSSRLASGGSPPARQRSARLGACAVAVASALCFALGCQTKSAGAKPFPVPRDEPWIPERYVAYRSLEPLRIDGRLDERSWLVAPDSAAFVDIQGRTHAEPRFGTHAKMLWDADYFYVAARLSEPHLWATYRKRDSIIFHENDFEVFIDPDADNHRYVEIEINALGTVWDLLLVKPYRDGGPAKHDWNIAGLETAVSLKGTLNDGRDVDQGWSVEMAIPWTAFKGLGAMALPPEPGQQWRVNFSRVQWQLRWAASGYGKLRTPSGDELAEDNWVWSPQGLIAMHYPERWGFVQFSARKAGEQPERAVHMPDHTARQHLMQLYYAQKIYRSKHGKYASGVEPLKLPPAWTGKLRLLSSPGGYEARLPFPGGQARVDQLGRLQSSTTPPVAKPSPAGSRTDQAQ